MGPGQGKIPGFLQKQIDDRPFALPASPWVAKTMGFYVLTGVDHLGFSNSVQSLLDRVFRDHSFCQVPGVNVASVTPNFVHLEDDSDAE